MQDNSPGPMVSTIEGSHCSSVLKFLISIHVGIQSVAKSPSLSLQARLLR